VDGEPARILTRPGEWSHLVWTAPKGRFVLSFRPEGHGRLEARWAVIARRWPGGAKPLPPRPANLMPWRLSDSTALTGTFPPDAGRF